MAKRWAPVLLSVFVVLVALWWCLRANRVAIRLRPFPTPIHVSPARIAELNAETRTPLFAPSRSNTPIGADKEPQTPPPLLTGIVSGGGRAVALVKIADGSTTMAHIGETVDGWSIVAIASREIVVAHNGAQQTIALTFGEEKPRADDFSAPPTAPMHSLMASPSFDGLAAIRQRGLPEANIPLGSPLVRSH